jgi:hypothetical protein
MCRLWEVHGRWWSLAATNRCMMDPRVVLGRFLGVRAANGTQPPTARQGTAQRRDSTKQRPHSIFVFTLRPLHMPAQSDTSAWAKRTGCPFERKYFESQRLISRLRGKPGDLYGEFTRRDWGFLCGGAIEIRGGALTSNPWASTT